MWRGNSWENVGRWREAVASHTSSNTMGSGDRPLDEHLRARAGGGGISLRRAGLTVGRAAKPRGQNA